MTDRRPSIVERRPSAIKSRRPSMIPTLEGIEKPNLNDALPENVKCDILISGTGLIESILAAALSWEGSNVIHIDSNHYYGDCCATLTIDQLKKWIQNCSSKIKKSGFKNYENLDLFIDNEFNSNYKSKDYGIDLSPKILFTKSELLNLLIKSRVYHYLEFQSISNFHTFENNSFGKIISSKEDIFTNDSLNLLSKRKLMKFLKFIVDDNYLSNLTDDELNEKSSIQCFLKNKFKLDDKFINELCFTLGLINDPNTNIKSGLSNIRRYLLSLNIYGNFPALYSKFGGSGELSQGFCRSAAVAGTTYKLNTKITKIDKINKIVYLNDGSHFKVNEKIIINSNQNLNLIDEDSFEKSRIARMIVIVDKPCVEWFNENEYAAIVIFPPMSLETNNKYPIQCKIMGSNTGCCPKGQCLWYLQTLVSSDNNTNNTNNSINDLNSALNKLKESILRESNFDYNNFNEDDFDEINNSLNKTGSLKLSESLKNLKIKNDDIKILLKLNFVQLINKDLIKKDNIIISNMPSSDLSYAGVVEEAKKIYKEIVGDDVDFFDVDFEDEEEEREMNEYNKKIQMELKLQQEEAIFDDETDQSDRNNNYNSDKINQTDELEFEL